MSENFVKVRNFVVNLPRKIKVAINIYVDVILCALTTWLAFYLRLGEFPEVSINFIVVACLSAFIAVLTFYFLNLYKEITRFSGLNVLLSFFRAVLIYGFLFALLIFIFRIEGVPRTIGFIQPALLLFFVGLVKISVCLLLQENYRAQNLLCRKVLIYGAGEAGRQLAAAIKDSSEMRLMGFLDDDVFLQNQSLNGLPIFNPAHLSDLVHSLAIQELYLAMPAISRQRHNSILSEIQDARVSVRTLPRVSDLAQGRVNISDVRELEIEELLGREPIEPDETLIVKTITDKTVLVTGAGGSIGSELCRQIIHQEPKQILLFEQSESSLYEIHKELMDKDLSVSLIPLLGSVQDDDRIKQVINHWRPQTVYHAAAYKHVPLVEHNIVEGIQNNVMGTIKTVLASIDSGAENFVLISTDKAVRPTNIMGASKRLAEMVLQALSSNQKSTKLSMVRFGNVLGSSGSVVPLFREQIRRGGPLTLTHKQITRFFMTIPEAAQLVLQASAMSKGGDVFVLDMGDPVKIIDLAMRMVELSGFQVKDEKNVDGDIEIKIIGLRPGEKLYEELLIDQDAEATEHPRIMRAKDEFLPWEALEKRISILEKSLLKNDLNAIRDSLENLVLGYTPTKSIFDWSNTEKG